MAMLSASSSVVVKGLGVRGPSRAIAPSIARNARIIRAEQTGATAAAPAAKKKSAVKEPWVQPQLDDSLPSPIFGGSTGGLLKKAQMEELYVITWEAPKEQIFEMPTGGAAVMRKGPNLLKLARKEQCLALTTQLRSKFRLTPCFYRVYADGTVEYLHPNDGVYPEKVNAGRVGVNQNMRSIGDNVDPIQVKFTGQGPFQI